MHTRVIVISEDIKDVEDERLYPTSNVDEEEIVGYMGLLTSGLADSAERLYFDEDDESVLDDLKHYVEGYFTISVQDANVTGRQIGNEEIVLHNIIVLEPNIDKFKESYDTLVLDIKSKMVGKPFKSKLYSKLSFVDFTRRRISETDIYIYNIPYGIQTAEEFYEETLCNPGCSNKFYLVSYFDVHF